MSYNIMFFIFFIPLLSYAIGGRGPLENVGKDGLKNEKPPYINDIGVEEKMGESIDLSLKFTDDQGQEVALSKYFQDKPVLMMLVYYTCPTLCSTHLTTVMNTLDKFEMKSPREFQVVAISIDPDEDSKIAEAKKKEFLENTSLKADGVHFLTGAQQNITKVSEQLGFKYAWDSNMKQWAHTAVSYILSPEGKISYYHYGLRIEPKVLRLSLVEASDNKVGNILDRVVLYCLQYDPTKKTYAFYAYNIMKFAAVVTMIILGFFLGRFWYKQRQLNS